MNRNYFRNLMLGGALTLAAVFSAPEKSHAAIITTLFDSMVNAFSLSETVPPISVGNLSSYQGKYLKVYYVVGRSQFLDQQTQINVLEIKRIDLVPINESEIFLPSVKVVKKSIFAAYNFVILVVTDDPNYTLYNPDGSVATAQTPVSQPNLSALKVAISKDELLQPSIAAGTYAPGQEPPEKFIPFKINF
ncbi:MAG: hypothetical protein ACK5P5_00515 [Pseudobdellovibrionaceae bacterium]